MVAGVLAEAVLLRLLARGGVYFLDDAPDAIRGTYSALVNIGVGALNFASIAVLVALGVMVLARLDAPSAMDRVLGAALALILATSIAVTIWSPAPAAALGYLLVSAFAAALIAFHAMRRERALSMRLAIVGLAATYGLLLIAKALPLAGQLGWGESGGVSVVVTISEIVTGLAIVTLAVSNRATRTWRAWVPGAAVTIVLLGMSFGMKDAVPLIGIWAFGLTLDLPVAVYAIGAGLVTWIVFSALLAGRASLAAALVMVFLAHRLLPLVYFNVLMVYGLALLARLPHESLVTGLDRAAATRTEELGQGPTRGLERRRWALRAPRVSRARLD